VLELVEKLVVEVALTVTVRPALTLDFTFMTHSPSSSYVYDMVTVFRHHYTSTLTSVLELVSKLVVEVALTVTVRPALTLDFTFMTHSPSGSYVYDMVTVFRHYYSSTLTSTLVLTETVVVERTATVIVRPALTEDFTFMTHPLT
jgi:hypothetical protein